MDWFAIVSLGAYPTPTPPTAAQRMGYAVTQGLIGALPSGTTVKNWSGWMMGLLG